MANQRRRWDSNPVAGLCRPCAFQTFALVNQHNSSSDGVAWSEKWLFGFQRGVMVASRSWFGLPA